MSILHTSGLAAISVAALAASAVLAGPASAEPQPWHDPHYVAASTASNKAQVERDERLAAAQEQEQALGTWADRYEAQSLQQGSGPASTCPAPAASGTEANKAQVEYTERLAQEC